MRIAHLILASCAIGSLAGCGKEPPPPSVEAFIDDPILLDATMVRCVDQPGSIHSDRECINAREAAERIAAATEKARRETLEAESARKRQALRRAREVADEARRQAQLREQAEYLGLVEPATGEPVADADSEELSFIEVDDGGTAVSVTVEDLPVPPPSGEPQASPDLGQIRDELKERQNDP